MYANLYENRYIISLANDKKIKQYECMCEII
jgi:hypothetical protein